jgi:hypothetical protein
MVKHDDVSPTRIALPTMLVCDHTDNLMITCHQYVTQ